MKQFNTYINEKLKISSNTKTYEDEVAVIESELNNRFNVRFTKTGGFEIIDKTKVNHLRPGDRKYIINGDHTAVRWTKYTSSQFSTSKWEVTRLIKNNLTSLAECIEVLKNYINKNDKP